MLQVMWAFLKSSFKSCFLILFGLVYIEYNVIIAKKIIGIEIMY